MTEWIIFAVVMSFVTLILVLDECPCRDCSLERFYRSMR